MSLENAILEHAAAIRELAKALAERNVPLAALAGQAQTAIQQITEDLKAGNTVDSSGADKELEQAVEKVEADAYEEARRIKHADTEHQPDPKPDVSGAAESAGTSTGAEPLNYDTDVKPLLVKVASKCGKAVLADLLKGVGLPEGQKGDKLDAKQLVAAKAKAEALIAG